MVRDDIMLGTTSSLQTRNFGPLSYALMEDSGWYLPKWDTVVRPQPRVSTPAAALLDSER